MSRYVVLLLSFLMLFIEAPRPWAADESSSTTASPDSSGTNTAQPGVDSTEAGSASLRVKPGPEDGRIAFATARLLEQMHYSHQRLNDDVSGKFYELYLESLDPRHMHFLQSDLAEFEKYRTNLDDLTITRRGLADTTPAFEIFSRFMERMEQRVKYADELLKTEKFTFDTGERVVFNRKDLPNPKDLDEARQIWRQQVRAEYLQEKLGLEKAKKKETEPRTGAAEPRPIHEQIVDTLSHRYHRTLRLYTDQDNEDVLALYLTALAHVYDPHSDYFNRAQLESFSISMNLQLFGIGAELLSEDGYCKIQRLLPGGPAAKSKKIRERDRIVAVAQGEQPPVDIVDMSITKAVQLIRGPKGTEVRLTIIPAGADSSTREIVTLIRDEIPLDDQAAKGKIIELPDPNGVNLRLGYIDLPSFYASMDLGRRSPELAAAGEPPQVRSTSADVTKLLKKFKQEQVKGVILDLRRNGGGSLEEAVKLTGLFIKEGPVVQVRSSDGNVVIDRDSDPSVAYDGPLIVLTSRFSASASEILAGALQDYDRGLVVGDASTHGKGTVQTIQNLSALRMFSRTDTATEPGAVKVTIRKFYRASGASTQKKGVVPDIVLPSVLNHSKDIGEAAMENALEWDVIPGAKFETLNLVQPYLGELLRRSSQRVATNIDFSYVREDIERFRKQQEDRSISLNEQERIREMEEAEARTKAREKERLARKEPNEKIYEITLKLADLPGLPPPVQKTNTIATASSNGAEIINTNSAPIVGTVTGNSSEQDPADDETLSPADAAVDTDLLEAKQIMVDYLSLLAKDSVAKRTAQ